jgi:hypothetical protein
LTLLALYKNEYLYSRATIEEICLAAPVISDIPKSVTNKFSSVTENAAIEYPERIKELCKMINSISWEIADTSDLMKFLPEDEKFIVELKYLDDRENTWKEIIEKYDKKFDISISLETVKRKKNLALEKIHDMILKKQN